MPPIEKNDATLIDAVKRMGADEFDAFLEEALAVRRRAMQNKLSPTETKLIRRINRGLPAALAARYADLIAKRNKKTLSKEEHRELLQLTHEAETQDADRAAALMELATLRRVPVRALMKQLGIRPATHG
jgi:hypothetical protein